MHPRHVIKTLTVAPGSPARLSRRDPAWTGSIHKRRAAGLLENGIVRLAEQQELLYAQDRHALLLVLQAMDAAGKDSVIKHVMSGVNPQGCQVFSFKAPSAEERDHDFLWRTAKALPERGRIGIHNRSHYEEVIVVRVHPELLRAEKLPAPLPTRHVWRRRFRDINAFERHLTTNGTAVVKVFLHVSRAEQRVRFLERLDRPEKHWKFSAADVRERAHWDEYMEAYEDMLSHTSTAWAPWYVVPADHKWFTRLAVAEILIARLEAMRLAYPVLSPGERTELDEARRQLEAEKA
jgi:PPK2 family polyphosphate:nucleotide phosphotransferase